MSKQEETSGKGSSLGTHLWDHSWSSEGQEEQDVRRRKKGGTAGRSSSLTPAACAVFSPADCDGQQEKLSLGKGRS